MSGSAAAAWQNAIVVLQHCCATAGELVPDSAEAEAAHRTVAIAIQPLTDAPPKAVWKTLVVQKQVPLQIGTAFAAAAQYGWKSPALQAAADVLLLLLVRATDAGARSLTSNVVQQLQQSGVLQPLAAAMDSMASDLKLEAAVLRDPQGAAGVDIDRVVDNTPHPVLTALTSIHSQLTVMWVGGEESLDPAVSWVCDPSGHVRAAMHLHTAAVQHASAVLPVVQQRAPQQAEALLQRLSERAQRSKGSQLMSLAVVLVQALSGAQKQGGPPLDTLNQLLLSPPTMPFFGMLLVVYSGYIRGPPLPADSHGVRQSSSGSGGGTCSSSSSGSGGTGRRGQQQCAAAGGDNNSSSSNRTARATPAACELQLLDLLGLAPEVVALMQPPLGPGMAPAVTWLGVAADLCTGCYNAVKGLVQMGTSGTGARGLGEQHQWMVHEQQLWLLLQTVLLPCAHKLLSPRTQARLQQKSEAAQTAQHLLQVSRMAMHVSALLCEGLRMAETMPAGLVDEVLGVGLQLADRLALQLPRAPAEAEAAAAPGSARGSSSSSSSSSRGRGSSRGASSCDPPTRAACAAHLLAVLSGVARESQKCLTRAPSSSTDDGGSASAAAVAPVAARFVEFAAAVEAALRATTAAAQSGTAASTAMHLNAGNLCGVVLLVPRGHAQSLLVQHMGLRGPVALAQEQRQVYSLLSTVLKLARDGPSLGAQSCWDEVAAGSCCLAGAQVAVKLLQLTSAPPTTSESSAATDQLWRASAAAAAEQPAADYLPSLVLFGRCCLQWAGQLQQQAPELLLFASGALPQQREDALVHEESAACVCIPGLRKWPSLFPGRALDSLTRAVSGWLSGLESPSAALTRLAAAGCAPEQLQQQLDALLAAQQDMWEGIADEPLAALVQELRVTGRMLSSIAVPHFCNNPACGNINGPTEVRLVSGHGCMCSACRTARYCCRDCQRAAWKQHRPVCKALAAAAAAAAAAAERVG